MSNKHDPGDVSFKTEKCSLAEEEYFISNNQHLAATLKKKRKTIYARDYLNIMEIFVLTRQNQRKSAFYSFRIHF